MKNLIVPALIASFTTQLLLAADEPLIMGDVELPAVASSIAFEQIKKNLGRWEGETKSVSYRCRI